MSSETPKIIKIRIDDDEFEVFRNGNYQIEFKENGVLIAVVSRLSPKSREVGREALLKIIDAIHDAYAQMVQAILDSGRDC